MEMSDASIAGSRFNPSNPGSTRVVPYKVLGTPSLQCRKAATHAAWRYASIAPLTRRIRKG